MQRSLQHIVFHGYTYIYITIVSQLNFYFKVEWLLLLLLWLLLFYKEQFWLEKYESETCLFVGVCVSSLNS